MAIVRAPFSQRKALPSQVGGLGRTLLERFDQLPTVSIKDFGADHGAVGDGIVRNLSASTVAAKTSTFGFSGATRLDDFDDDDTEDWLAAALAIKHLVSVGGGTLYVPRPEVSYPLFRYIPLPAGVPIRVVGDGFIEGFYDFDNVNDLPGIAPNEWEAIERRAVFQPPHFKWHCLWDDMGFGVTTPCTRVDIATRCGYSAIVPLATGGGATFAVGDRVVLFNHVQTYTSTVRYSKDIAFREIVAISGDELLLDSPIPFLLPNGEGKVAKMGTGADAKQGGAAYDFIENFHLEGLNVRGSTLWYSAAGRGCSWRDWGIRSDRAVTSNSGFQFNGFIDSYAKNSHIITKRFAVEIKGGSGGRFGYNPDDATGGTGLLLEDTYIRLLETDQTIPPISIGESSSAKLERVWLHKGATGPSTAIALDDFRVVILRDMNLSADLSVGGSIGLQYKGQRANSEPSILDLEGMYLGGDDGEWRIAMQCLDPADGRTRPIMFASRIRSGVDFRSGQAAGAFHLPFGGATSVADYRSETGETLGFTGTSVAASPIKGVLGATAAQIPDAGHWINTRYRQWGRYLWDTTNSRLLWSTGSTWVPIVPDHDPRLADTGWTALALATDITVGSSWPHRGARKIGKEVILNFNLNPIANPVADKLLFTLDAAFRPTNLGGLRLALNPGSGALVRIAENGEVRAHSGATLSIGEVRFLVD